MLKNYDEVSRLIEEGALLHIAGTESLLRKLPKGNWIGGSTEYFMAKEGGLVSNEQFFVTVFPYTNFKIETYDENTISAVTEQAYDNGYSILIAPFDSAVHRVYAEKAAEFDGMFLKNIVGWVSGLNLAVPGQTPIAVNGLTGEAYSDKAVALHIETPADKMVSIGIINIFEQDGQSPLIEFEEEGFSVTHCLVNGQKVKLADYLKENSIDTRLPLVGEYSGSGINISFKQVSEDKVDFYAPVFAGIQYRIAKGINHYEDEFNSQLAAFKDAKADFACNCILNFLYGELEGKSIDTFTGPITFGEIAYALVNQTLVYVTVQ